MTNKAKTVEALKKASKNSRSTQKGIQEQFKIVKALMKNLRIVFPLIKVRHQSQKLYSKVIM